MRLTRLRESLRNEGTSLAVGARGDQGWLGALPEGWAEVVARGLVFSVPSLSKPAGLKEGIGRHCHQGVAMQPDPGTTLEMVEAEFFLELLTSLLADPARLNRPRRLPHRSIGR